MEVCTPTNSRSAGTTDCDIHLDAASALGRELAKHCNMTKDESTGLTPRDFDDVEQRPSSLVDTIKRALARAFTRHGSSVEAPSGRLIRSLTTRRTAASDWPCSRHRERCRNVI
jgi:hypothetical protein